MKYELTFRTTGISEILPNKYRGIGLGWTEFCIGIPWGALSVYIATLLLVHATWRWTYYIVIIYSIICVLGTFVFYFPPSRPQHDVSACVRLLQGKGRH